VRGETGCFLWVIQQSKVVGCCPGVQVLTVRRCFVVTPVDMLAVEVTNIQTGMWERRDGRWCESRAWRFVDIDDLVSCNAQRLRTTTQSLIDLETDRPVTIPTAHGQTWQGHDSCSGLTQLVRIWESLACLQLCSGSPVVGITKALFLYVSCSMTEALFSVSLSVFGLRMLGRGSSAAFFAAVP